MKIDAERPAPAKGALTYIEEDFVEHVRSVGREDVRFPFVAIIDHLVAEVERLEAALKEKKP